MAGLSKTIVLLPGDGIGPEVIAAATAVLADCATEFHHRFTLREFPVGGAALDRAGAPLPPETLAACREADAILLGAGDELVVDVGVVLDVPDVVALELEVAAQHVEDDVAHGVAEVALGVGRDAADVHEDAIVARRELLDAAAQGVVEAQLSTPGVSLRAKRSNL